MTTAKVEYTTSCKYGYCFVNFSGSEAENLQEGWHQICYNKYNRHKDKIRDCEASIESCETACAELKAQRRSSKKWYRPWYTKAERGLTAKIKQEKDRIEELRCEIDSLTNNMFDTGYELRQKAEKYLRDLGFVITNSSRGGYYGSQHTDIWTRY